MREYYEISLNVYPNIFICPRIDQINTQTHLDAQQMTKQTSKYILIEKKTQIEIKILFVANFLGIFLYFKICVHHCSH